MNRPRRIRIDPASRFAVPAFAVLLMFGIFAGLISTSSSAAGSCSLYASPAGSDSNDGSSARPFATVAKLVGSLGAGQVGCLAAGQTFTGDVNLSSSNGTASAPVVVTSSDPSSPATIVGRVTTHPGADYLTFRNLRFTWNSGGTNLPSITVGSDHFTLSNDDVSNGNTAICIDVIADATWGTAHGTVIDHSRIHNCGVRPVTSYSSPGYLSHGLYISGVGTQITNNYIYANSGKGVLLRGSNGAVVSNNVIDGNGSGVAFGDLSASNNEVMHNIITNSTAGCACNTFGVLSWWGSTAVGTNNTFHDNCLHGNAQGDVSTSAGGFTASSNTIADPGYADASSGNYTVSSGSPCAADAPSGTVGPGGTAPTPTTSGGTTAAPTTTTTASAPTTTSVNVGTAPVASSLPVISGSAVVGSYLSTTTGAWGGTSPIAYSYQWQHCDSSGHCTPVAGATTPNFVPAASDEGMSIRVAVTAANAAGTTVAVSDATAPVIAPPASTSLPSISGQLAVGSTLSASVGTWTGANLAYNYNWLRCNGRGGNCSPIDGATSATYVATPADVGSRLRVMVSAQNQAGSASATSDPTALLKQH